MNRATNNAVDRAERVPGAAPAQRTGRASFLPDFCTIRTVFAVVIIGELLAFVLTLAAFDAQRIWYDLSLTSLFVQWVVLLSAAVLCLTRRLLSRLTTATAALASYALLLAVTLGVTEISYWTFHHLSQTGVALERWHSEFLFRNLTIGAIISAIFLRYMYMQYQWQARLESESRARIQALQSRIRPHFLFNSMNVIASLTRTDPALAEEAVEDLADLFRASLADANRGVTLAEEVEITERYLHIEKLRLGERLQVDWALDQLPRDARVPALLIQPLVENAIYHGVEPCERGGRIAISGEFDGHRILIVISNPLPRQATAVAYAGNRMAVENVRQRLEVYYDRPGSIAVVRGDADYRVTIEIPYVRERQ